MSDKAKDSKSQFGRAAKKYATSRIHQNKDDLNRIISIIKPKSNWKVLDVATGAGHLAHKLAEKVNSVIASDITKEMLEQTELIAAKIGLYNIKTEIIDVHNIPYNSNYFDLVTSRIAPHHFEIIDVAIKEMTRVTKPGGYIFIEDTISPENNDAASIFNLIERLRDYSHNYDLSKTQWEEILISYGCSIEHSSTQVKEWPLKWWTERMSTPRNNVLKILELLEIHFERHSKSIGIIHKDGKYNNLEEKLNCWTLTPKNGYFLAKKKN